MRCFGFGYDSKTCDYKFVSVYCQPDVDGYEDMDVSQVEIHTLGSDSWENYHSYNPYQINEKRGVFLNGAIHWSANLRTSLEWQPRLLISMDMEDECSRYYTFGMWEMKDYYGHM
ncbi:uncharacterized protein LOC113344898 [Papaver somniferum]|uniref:uncharacterized protein LOC113344898 n=1 Tax=Papaver somniferum TaxID=3469 RepID=UPI000E6FB9AB|nr:uncharacterized protein LOC113344898 [Papaver somniferum]